MNEEIICTRTLGVVEGRPPGPLPKDGPITRITHRWQVPILQHHLHAVTLDVRRVYAHLPLFLFFSPSLVLSRSTPGC